MGADLRLRRGLSTLLYSRQTSIGLPIGAPRLFLSSLFSQMGDSKLNHISSSRPKGSNIFGPWPSWVCCCGCPSSSAQIRSPLMSNTSLHLIHSLIFLIGRQLPRASIQWCLGLPPPCHIMYVAVLRCASGNHPFSTSD